MQLSNLKTPCFILDSDKLVSNVLEFKRALTEKLNKPVIFLVNQLDNEKCDYDNILEQLKEAYGSKVVPIQYPISTGCLLYTSRCV